MKKIATVLVLLAVSLNFGLLQQAWAEDVKQEAAAVSATEEAAFEASAVQADVQIDPLSEEAKKKAAVQVTEETAKAGDAVIPAIMEEDKQEVVGTEILETIPSEVKN